MEAYGIRSFTTVEIGQKLDEAYEELFNLRFQRATGQLKNTARKGEWCGEVARLKTVLRVWQSSHGWLRRRSNHARATEKFWSAVSPATRWTKRWWCRPNWLSRHPIYGKVICSHRESSWPTMKATNARLAMWCASPRRGRRAAASAGLWTLSWSMLWPSAGQAARFGSQYEEYTL